MRGSPSVNSLISVNAGAVEGYAQEITEVLFPFLNDAHNLEEFIIKHTDSLKENLNHPLYSAEFLSYFFSHAKSDLIIDSLYSERNTIYIFDKPDWVQQPDYLQRLVEIISKSKQLERVFISCCGLDGTSI